MEGDFKIQVKHKRDVKPNFKMPPSQQQQLQLNMADATVSYMTITTHIKTTHVKSGNNITKTDGVVMIGGPTSQKVRHSPMASVLKI